MHVDWAQIFIAIGGFAALSHALDTFPVPDNAYAKWFIGVLQYIVGQRSQSNATMNNMRLTPLKTSTLDKLAEDPTVHEVPYEAPEKK